jgi:pilus assembly protein FimV
MTRKLLQLLLSTVSLVPLCASALGVGKIELRSALNQKLEAEIELIPVGGEELGDLVVNLAPMKAFVQAGIERPAVLLDLKFAVQTRADGKAVVKVTSTQPIREPNLDFLLEFTWPKGHLVREFAILLDPSTSVTDTPFFSSADDKAAVLPSSRLVPSSTASVYSGKSYGPVAFGETLSEIASKLRPDRSISIRRMTQLLFRANPDAFSKPNPDSLLAGKTLRVPSLDQIRATEVRRVGSEAAASADARGEMAGLEGEASQLRLLPPEAETPNDTSSVSEAPVNPSQALQEGSVPALSTGFQIKRYGGRPSLRVAGLDDLRNHLDTLVSSEQDPNSSGTVQGSVPAAVHEAPPSILREADSPGSAQQAPSPEMPPEASVPQTSFLEASPAGVAPAETEAPEQTPEASSPPVVASQPDSAVTAVSPPVTASPSAGIAPSVLNPASSQAQSVVKESGLQESLIANVAGMLLSDPKMVALLGIVATLLATLSVLLVRRKSAVQEDLTEELAIVGSNVDLKASRPSSVATPEPITPVTAKPRLSPNLLEKVDLLLGLGDYSQAVTLLKPAIARDPAGTALLAKLLDVYFAAGNRKGFLKEAQNLRERLGAEADPVWVQVCQRGRELCGAHPLFASEAEPEVAASDTSAAVAEDEEVKTEHVEKILAGLDYHLADFGKESQAVPATPESEAASDASGSQWHLPDAEPITTPPLLGETAAKKVERSFDAEVNAADIGQEFEWQPLEPDLSTARGGKGSEAQAEERLKEQLDGLSFGLEEMTTPVWQRAKGERRHGADEPRSPETGSQSKTDPGRRLPSWEFELEKTVKSVPDLAADELGLSAEDYVETKLDLAIAYLGMDDREGARSLLEEVLKEGTPEQKQRAQECMARLGVAGR